MSEQEESIEEMSEEERERYAALAQWCWTPFSEEEREYWLT